MNKVILVGQLNNTNEVKMSNNNLEILEFLIEGIKVKSFGELATKVKSMQPTLVYAEGQIKLKDYTNKEGKTFPIQELIINRVEPIEHQEKWGSAKEVVIDPDDLPFY